MTWPNYRKKAFSLRAPWKLISLPPTTVLGSSVRRFGEGGFGFSSAQSRQHKVDPAEPTCPRRNTKTLGQIGRYCAVYPHAPNMPSNNDNENADHCVLIIGGGPAGLLLAQGLKRASIPVQVFERDVSPPTQGYRFGLAEEGILALQRTLPPAVWELLEKTHPESPPTVPGSVDAAILDAHTGASVPPPPLHNGPGRPGLAPAEGGAAEGPKQKQPQRVWPMDRPWMQQVLRLGLESVLHGGKVLARFEVLHDGGGSGDGSGDGSGRGRVCAHFEDGTSATGAFLVAADGVNSAVRRQLLPHAKLLDLERTSVWGRTPLDIVVAQQLQGEGKDEDEDDNDNANDNANGVAGQPDLLFRTGAVLDARNPSRSCIFNPIRWPHAGRLSELSNGLLRDQVDYLFWVVLFPTARGFSAPAKQLLSSHEDRLTCLLDTLVADWHPALKAMVAGSDSTAALPMVSNPPTLPELPAMEERGPMTFVGDSIHAMSPSSGSGGLSAVLDAADLCEVLVEAWKHGSERRNGDEERGGAGWDRVALEKGVQRYEQRMLERAGRAIEFGFARAAWLFEGRGWKELGYYEGT